ncbi:MAG: glutamate--cysteine ligase [Alphaproteobacteria bacterium]
MSGPSTGSSEPVTDRRQLVEAIARGAKPRADWRIGTEHEKFVFNLADHRPAPYDGPAGIRALFEGLTRFGWTPIMEGNTIIALSQGAENVSLEPGGQFELSGAPLASVHETCAEVNTHLKQVKAVGAELGLGFLGLGFQPRWTRADTPWMPKGRYKIMRAYMPKKGSLGLDMMLRTCTVQVNLDFGDEADMVKKLRVGLALQPVATALFANSPFTEGRPNGYLSLRAHVWSDTDPDRTGMLPFAFEPGMGYERYVDYALDVPMYFVYRDGRYIDASGQSFRDFLAGRLPALPGQVPTLGDWDDHLTTLFPEVRLKRFLEMRGADSGPWRRLCALPALWVGLLYDQGALDAAWDLVKGWNAEAREAMRVDVPKRGFATKTPVGPMIELARRVLAIADEGLRRRATGNGRGTQLDETCFITTLHEIVAHGRTPAEDLLDAYATRWNESVDEVFREYAF